MSEAGRLARARADADRNFRLLIAFTINLYCPLYWPYMFHYVCVVHGLSALEFGTLKSVYYLSVIVFEVPGGMLADRFGRRTALLGCALLNAAACFLYASGTRYAGFAVAELVMGLSTAMLSGADSALLFDSMRAAGRADRYAHAEGLTRTATFAAAALGLVVSDHLLIPRGGPALTYSVTGVLSLLGGLAVIFLREPPREPRDTGGVTRSAIADALRMPKVVRVLLYGTGIYVLARAANSALYNPLLAANGFSVSRYGTLSVGMNIVGALAAWRTSAWLGRHGERPLLVALPVAGYAMYAALAVAHGPLVILIIAAQGALMSVVSVLSPVAINRELVSSRHRATVLSLQSVFWRGGYALAAPLIGWSLDHDGLRGALAMSAALGAVPLLACCVHVRLRRTHA